MAFLLKANCTYAMSVRNMKKALRTSFLSEIHAIDST